MGKDNPSNMRSAPISPTVSCTGHNSLLIDGEGSSTMCKCHNSLLIDGEGSATMCKCRPLEWPVPKRI